MGQYLQPDRIKPLSYASSVVSLPTGSFFTIGGQQYVNTAPLSVTLSGLTAIGLYMVYAVISAGIPALVVSANVNSVGPAGFTRWKLVGAFYASGATTLGGFVTIEGVPTTSQISITPLNGQSGTYNGFGTTTAHDLYYTRIGNRLFLNGNFTTGSATTGAEARFPLPDGLTSSNDVVQNGPCGYYYRAISAVPHGGALMKQNGAAFILFSPADIFSGTANSAQPNSAANVAGPTERLLIQFNVAITGWSNTPLKDL